MLWFPGGVNYPFAQADLRHCTYTYPQLAIKLPIHNCFNDRFDFIYNIFTLLPFLITYIYIMYNANVYAFDFYIVTPLFPYNTDSNRKYIFKTNCVLHNINIEYTCRLLWVMIVKYLDQTNREGLSLII